MYLDSNISSTESDVNMRRKNAWAAIDWLSTIWKSNLSDKIKMRIIPSCSGPCRPIDCISSECPNYDTKQSDDEIPVMLDL